MSERLNRTAAYLQAGRKHANLSVEALSSQWVNAFRAMAGDPENPEVRAAEDDLESEYDLRLMIPPLELVRAEENEFCAKVDAITRELRVSDPERSREIHDEMLNDIERYRVARSGS